MFSSPDIWFHRYENGKDIEGRCELPNFLKSASGTNKLLVDYNSWQETDESKTLVESLKNKDFILAEGMSNFLLSSRLHLTPPILYPS